MVEDGGVDGGVELDGFGVEELGCGYC